MLEAGVKQFKYKVIFALFEAAASLPAENLVSVLH